MTGEYNCTPKEIADGKVCGEPPSKYTIFFKKVRNLDKLHSICMVNCDSQGKKYLLRLINTSVDTTFIFAIDNHDITVISSDFVPIVPYKTASVLVGIGKERENLHSEASKLSLSL